MLLLRGRAVPSPEIFGTTYESPGRPSPDNLPACLVRWFYDGVTPSTAKISFLQLAWLVINLFEDASLPSNKEYRAFILLEGTAAAKRRAYQRPYDAGLVKGLSRREVKNLVGVVKAEVFSLYALILRLQDSASDAQLAAFADIYRDKCIERGNYGMWLDRVSRSWAAIRLEEPMISAEATRGHRAVGQFLAEAYERLCVDFINLSDASEARKMGIKTIVINYLEQQRLFANSLANAEANARSNAAFEARLARDREELERSQAQRRAGGAAPAAAASADGKIGADVVEIVERYMKEHPRG